NQITDATMDVARLTFGELKLKEYFKLKEYLNSLPTNASGSVPESLTNTLQAAQTNFERVIQDFSSSPLLGKAYLDRGWCSWARDDFSAAKSDFETAGEYLPFSEDQAVARFKLADSLLRLHEYDGAV